MCRRVAGGKQGGTYVGSPVDQPLLLCLPLAVLVLLLTEGLKRAIHRVDDGGRVAAGKGGGTTTCTYAKLTQCLSVASATVTCLQAQLQPRPHAR